MSGEELSHTGVVWSGVLEYRGDHGLRGVEHWSVTVADDSSRILSARCRMFDSQLERWVVHSVDRNFRPVHSFVSQRQHGQFLGEGSFRFIPGQLTADIHQFGRIDTHQEVQIDGDLDYFVPHAVAADAWITPCYDRSRGGWQEIPHGYASSLLPDGSTGPMIEQHRGLQIMLAGEERVMVPAGEFDAWHYLVSARPGVEEHLWVARNPARTLIKLRSDRLATTYVLTELHHETLWPSRSD